MEEIARQCYGDGGKRMRLAGYVTRMEEKRDTYGVLVGKPYAERLVARLMLVGEDSVPWIVEA
jgi:hypothetical protein